MAENIDVGTIKMATEAYLDDAIQSSVGGQIFDKYGQFGERKAWAGMDALSPYIGIGVVTGGHLLGIVPEARGAVMMYEPRNSWNSVTKQYDIPNSIISAFYGIEVAFIPRP